MKIGYSQSDCTYGNDTVYATGTTTIPSYTITSSPYTISTSTSYNSNDFLQKFNKYLKEQAEKKEDSLLQVNIGKKKINLTDKILQIKKEQDVHFINIIERNPGRVYEFVFQDGTHIKTVCAEEDLKIFNLKYAFFLALAKYLYKDKYTFIGILNKVPELMQQKKYIKIVKEGMKLFKKQQEEKEKKEVEKRKIKAIKKNHYNKNKRRKENKKEKELNELKEIIKKAINETQEEE